MTYDGKMTVELSVWCKKCEVQEHSKGKFKNKRKFGSYLRLYGWRFTRAWGWICPSHNEEYLKMLRGK